MWDKRNCPTFFFHLGSWNFRYPPRGRSAVEIHPKEWESVWCGIYWRSSPLWKLPVEATTYTKLRTNYLQMQQKIPQLKCAWVRPQMSDWIMQMIGPRNSGQEFTIRGLKFWTAVRVPRTGPTRSGREIVRLLQVDRVQRSKSPATWCYRRTWAIFEK